MAIEAELADGRILEFPDGTDPSVIQATVKKVLASGRPAPETTVLGQVKEGFKGLVPGAINLVESAATGASALLPEDMEKSAREKIKSVATAAKEPFAAAPGYEDSVGRKLSEAIGSTAPFLLAGPFGLAGRAAAVGLGVGAGAGEARTRAEAAGATADQRGTATALGMIPGALEAFAPLRILSRIPTASTSAGVELVKRALVAGGEEAAQEAASGFAQNLIAKGVYKPDQELIDGLGEQAAYGGATGAIVQGLMDLALGRRARGSQTTPAETPPQLPPQAPAGTQGTLFSEEEMGKRVAAETQPTPPAPGVEIPAGQQDLGLDFQREYADMLQERERLKQAEQTDEVKARVKELTEQMALYTQSDIESLRAEKEAQAAAAKEDAAARKKFPALAAAPDLLTLPDEVKARTQMEMFPGEDLAGPTLRETGAPTVEKPTAPTPVPAYQRTGPYQYKLPLRGGEAVVPFTMKDIEDTGIAPSTTKGWFEQNVVGKTTSEVQALVDKDPTLLDGKGKRAKILRELLAPQPAPFKEAPRVEQTPTATPAVEQRAEPRAGEPSVGVPSEPAPAELTEPGAGVPPTAAAPVTPDGLGLVPAGQSAVPGAAPQGAEPTAVEVETPEQEAARKQEAAELEARLRSVGAPTRVAPAAVKPAAPAPVKAPSAPIPEKMYEPTGTSEFGMEEGQKEILRGPQAMLFPMSKREELEYAERAKPETETETEDEAPAAAAKDDRQAELDLRAPRKTPAKKAAPAQPAVPAWAEKAAKSQNRHGEVIYSDNDVALIKYADTRNGDTVYAPALENLGNYLPGDIDTYTNPGGRFTDAQLQAMRDAKARAVEADRLAAAKYPDGVFTGAKSNVVAGDSVSPRYQKYLESLMKAMGMGDVRVFLYHSKDARGLATDPRASGNFYRIMARANPSETQRGGVVPFGVDGKDFMMFIKDGMSEAVTLEVIAHEYGHLIQKVAFDTAPAAVRDAVLDAHDAWVSSLKGKKVRDMVLALRNRTSAEDMDAQGKIPDMEIAKMPASDRAYWMGFAEWFADNVSRWATTADKPLTVTEKFFSKVAQLMRDLVAITTGRKFPPNKLVADFLEKMGPGAADTWLNVPHPAGQAVQPIANAVSFSTESLIDSMGPMEAQEKSGLRKLIDGYKDQSELGYAVKFRTQVADSAATIEHRLREQFDGAVKDKLGKLNPMGLYRQAQDYSKMLLEYLQVGAMSKEPATGLWKVKADAKVRPPVEVYAMIDKWAAKNGYSRERGTQIASRILEGVRLDAMRTANKNDGAGFLLHLKDAEIDQLVNEYKADPELQAMSKAMDEARLAMVDNMVAVGRLSAEQGKAWKDVAGYVPFDRIEDFATSFTKIKKVSNKGLAQVGKLPELVGSINRPVGNVFDNYLNTLGWMVGQTLKTDGTVQTLRSLEDAGHAKFIGRSPQGKDNVVGMYVKGEMMYWEVPSKYDVLAFKDLNPPKAKWLQVLGQASNVLRKAVTALPPFALKQVTDDVQRAIMTSGVKNPGALLRMTLTNFGGLALAELRGIQHPSVRQFGALGLTGEYDFQQGKPATSVLKDLGYRQRGKFETLLHRLDGITRASDLAVRKAIYDQTLKESNDELLAQTRAREFINFRRRGASDFVGAMVTTIPFFNAYIQGMDVLYRAASGKDSSSSVGRAQARRMFWSRAAIAMTLSSLYALGAGDDEDYQEMDLRTRDSNWILPGGLKIPVPTELGALFKVIPERVVEYMRRQGTPEEQTAWEATRTALAYIMEQYVGRTVPVPQGVKPLLEAWTNYSFFTGRELEGIYQKQQDPSLRRASNTSELAIAISEFSRDVIGVDKVSPIMIDNALNGYFGSTAGLLVAATDSLLNPTRVDRPLHKWALVSNYMYDPVGTRRMTEFYEEREKVGRANTTLAELMKTDLDKAAAYAEAHADELMLESAVNSTLEQLERTRAYRKYLNSAAAAEGMTKDEREATIKEVKQMEVSLTGWLREARTAMRQ